MDNNLKKNKCGNLGYLLLYHLKASVELAIILLRTMGCIRGNLKENIVISLVYCT